MEYPLEHDVYVIPSNAEGPMRFRVVPKDGGLAATVSLNLWNESWECNCPARPLAWIPDPYGRVLPGCLHIQDAYLFHLSAENRKNRMKKLVSEHAEIMKAHQEMKQRLEDAKPIGFVTKPKRKINLE